MAKDSNTVKDEQRQYWNDAAEGWSKNDARLRKSGEPVTRLLLELAGVAPGKRVLDIASGTGEPGLPAAEAVGPNGHVLLTDQSEEMLGVARAKAEERGLSNVEFRVVDGESLDVEPGSFDAATCRWGIMFMPEPVRCLRSVHRALKPGGRVAIAVWGRPDLNPFFTVPVAVLMQHKAIQRPAPGEPGVFAFADRSRLAAVLTEAGFRDIVLDDLRLPMAVYDTAEEYWESLTNSGAIAKDLRDVSPEVREAIRRDLFERVAGGDPKAPVSLDGYAVIASATK
jgi:ubiquinone/menaquinone biosynthesis C-methylase UbiE